jgi:hypothetical protein
MRKIFLPASAVFIVLVIGVIVSGYFDLWQRWENFDTVMHLSGSVVLAWLLSSLAVKQQKALPYLSYALFIAGAVLIFGVVWEVLEYLSGAHLKGTIIWHYYRGGNLQDTIADLLADLNGAMIYLLAHLVRRARN